MNNTKKFLSALALVAISVSAHAADTTSDLQQKSSPDAKKEKCFGIVKAGKNDCAAADGSHSCAGLAKNDADGHEWVLLPAGTCERVIGGLNAPKA